MVEHPAVNRVVAGSSPARGAIIFQSSRAHSSAAEQSAHNRSVPGSNPGGPTTKQEWGSPLFFLEKFKRRPALYRISVGNMNIWQNRRYLQGGTIEGKGKFFRNWQKIIPVQAGEMGHPIEITIEINRKIRMRQGMVQCLIRCKAGTVPCPATKTGQFSVPVDGAYADEG